MTVLAPISPAVMAELLLNRGVRSASVATDETMARHIALAIAGTGFRCLQAPTDYEAVRACLDRLWVDPGVVVPAEVAA